MSENNSSTTDNNDLKPNVTIAEVEKLLETVYGLKGGPIKPLEGYDDLNFHCLPNISCNPFVKGLWPHGYVFKVMNSLDSKNNALCEGQNELMLFLGNHGFPCPLPVKTVDGRLYVKETLPLKTEAIQKVHIIRLLNYQPGIVLRCAPKSYSLLYQVGIFVAKLNLVLKKFSHPVYKNHYSIWHLKSVPNLKYSMDIIETPKRRQLGENVIEKFTKEVLSKFETLEKGMIHGDLNENNILMAKSEKGEWRVSAVLDFGDSHESCYLFELAIALCYMMFECKRQNLNVVVGAGHFLAGYLTIRPNFSLDCSLLKFCICARICQSLVLGLKASKLQPGNAYVLGSQEMGWPILEELWELPVEKVTAEWMTVFQSYNIVRS